MYGNEYVKSYLIRSLKMENDMFLIIFEGSTLLGVIVLILFALLLGGMELISVFWGWIIYGVFLAASIFEIIVMYQLYFLETDKFNFRTIKKITRFLCSFVFPLLFMILTRRLFLKKVDFYKESPYPIQGTCFVVLIMVTIILGIIMIILSHVNIYISLILYASIILLSPVWTHAVDIEIAKHDVVEVISFEVKDSTRTQGTQIPLEKGDIVKSANVFHPSVFGSYPTVEIYDEKGRVQQVLKSKLKVSQYISRYDITYATE